MGADAGAVTAATTEATPTRPTNGANGPQTPIPGGTKPPEQGASDATQPPQAPAWKPPRLKVSGAEREVDADTYHAYAQKGAAWNHRNDELQRKAAELEAREKSAAERAKKDPWAFLKEHNPDFDPRKAAAEYVVSSANEEQLTPEQKELREARAKLEALETEKKTTAEKERQAKVEAVKRQRMEEYGRAWVGELQKLGVPEGAGAFTYLARMADMQEQADHLVSQGMLEKAPEPALMAKMAIEEVQAGYRNTVGKLRGAELLHAMGDDWVNAAIEAKFAAINAAKAQSGTQPPPAGKGTSTATPRNVDTGKFVSRERSDFLHRLGLVDGGGQ